MLSFCAPHQARLRDDPPLSGSSKGFDSCRRKCNIGMAKSHSGLDDQASFINWLQRLSIALVALLMKQNVQCKNQKLINLMLPHIIIMVLSRNEEPYKHLLTARRFAETS